MFDPSQDLAGLRIPANVLVALDYRPFHFALQPLHFLVRAAHILSASAFFGAIGVVDIRLMARRPKLPLGLLIGQVHTWLYVGFAIAFVTGLVLFFYDPVHVGSHAYFTLKLLSLVLGLVNSALFHRWGVFSALRTEGAAPPRARVAAAISLACWSLVMVCSSLNIEGTPKTLLVGGPQAASQN